MEWVHMRLHSLLRHGAALGCGTRKTRLLPVSSECHPLHEHFHVWIGTSGSLRRGRRQHMPGRSRLVQSKRLEPGKCCESEFGSCATKASPFPSLCHFLEVARGSAVLRSEGQTLVKKALAGRESGGLRASTGMLCIPREGTLWDAPTRSTLSSGCWMRTPCPQPLFLSEMKRHKWQRSQVYTP